MLKRILSAFITLTLSFLLTACVGVRVTNPSDCVCPTQVPDAIRPTDESALKIGLCIRARRDDSRSALETQAGEAAFRLYFAAVSVDASGRIVHCMLDSLSVSAPFDAHGKLNLDSAAPLQTLRSKGDIARLETLAASAVGKTPDALTFDAAWSDYAACIADAVSHAQASTARAEDELRLAVIANLADHHSADADAEGGVQIEADAIALILRGDIISACQIDAVQTQITFDQSGVISTDLSEIAQTKNQLGERYGLKAYAGSKYEWNEQAAAFAAYAVGKTAAEISGIAVREKSASDSADLPAGVTISIGGFQALIERACA